MGANGQFWIADPGQNHLLHYPSVDQLPVTNYAADASHPAISPRSGFVDQYNNLLVTDGIDRVLYFAPQVSVVNSANYIVGRPLAPGTIAAVFPALNTTSLSSGTESLSSLPLPTTLADTQALVNGAPTRLFYVSPGQINLPLSLGLIPGGTVDLQIVRQSTGQVYGAAEIPMASASPGFYTIGGTGTGQVAALNQDNTINSPTNPVLRGQAIQLFGTGQGFVPNAPPEGEASQGLLPTPLNPQVLLGAVYIPDSNILYSGIAPTEVGVWQINILIPATAQSGNNVPIKILMNSIPSQVSTTIAIK